MIYFDKTNLKILKKIFRRREKGVTLLELKKHYEKAFNKTHKKTESFSEFIYTLCEEEYIFCTDPEKSWSVNEVSQTPWWFFDTGIYRITEKGCELLQRRSFDFWKWMIPTIISIVSLVVSALTAK